MSETRLIAREQLASYLDDFAKRFLLDDKPRSIDVEILAGEMGDQRIVDSARLIGIAYDHKDDYLDFVTDHGDHRIASPDEVWAVEEPDGFVSALEVVCRDNVREIASVRRIGLQRQDEAPRPGQIPRER